MGRPLGAFKEVTDPIERIQKLAEIGCTDSEIAACCDISETTLQTRFPVLLKKGRENFKSEIRSMQFKRAKEGSDAMLIWLGKVVLGQKEDNTLRIDATDTLAAFVASIREAAPQGAKQVEGETLSPGEPLLDTRRGNGA